MKKLIDWTKPVEYTDGTVAYADTKNSEVGESYPAGRVAAVVDGNFYNAEGDHVFGHHLSVRNSGPSFDPTKPVQTRDGRPARIVATDKAGNKPIVALIGLTESPVTRYANGRMMGFRDNSADLINVAPKPVVEVTYRTFREATGEAKLGTVEASSYAEAAGHLDRNNSMGSEWEGILKLTRTNGKLTSVDFTPA